MISGSAVKKGKKVSISSNNDFDIQAVAYSFRDPKNNSASGSIKSAMPPLPWLYHDHALGVIWMLFHKDKKCIGISQLQWCRRFLLDLKNSEGEYTGDVEICIEAIEDTLIEQYSKLGTLLKNQVEKKNSARKKLSKVPDEAIDMIFNAERAERTEQVMRTSIKNENSIIEENDSINPYNFGPNDAMTNNKNGVIIEEEKLSPTRIREINGASTPSGDEKSRMLNDKNDEEHCSHRCASAMFVARMRPEEIMSFTYEEMLASGASPCTNEYFTVDVYDDSTFIDELIEKTADQIIHHGDPTGTNLAELANFLNTSRTQHLERIKIEIERLYGLEKFMENVNTNGFSAWITEDLARRLTNLREEDVIEVAEKIIKSP